MADRGAGHARLRRLVFTLLVVLVALQFSGCADPGAFRAASAAATVPVSTHHDGGTDGVCSSGPSAKSTADRAAAPLAPPATAPAALPASSAPIDQVTVCRTDLTATSGRALLETIGVSRT